MAEGVEARLEALEEDIQQRLRAVQGVGDPERALALFLEVIELRVVRDRVLQGRVPAETARCTDCPARWYCHGH